MNLVPGLMLDRIPKLLPLVPFSDEAKEECEKFFLVVMLDWIKEIMKSDFPISASGSDLGAPRGSRFF